MLRARTTVLQRSLSGQDVCNATVNGLRVISGRRQQSTQTVTGLSPEGTISRSVPFSGLGMKAGDITEQWEPGLYWR